MYQRSNKNTITYLRVKQGIHHMYAYHKMHEGLLFLQNKWSIFFPYSSMGVSVILPKKLGIKF
jgi:hypothetical protein